MRSRYDDLRPGVSSKRRDEIIFKDSFDLPLQRATKPYPEVDEDNSSDAHERRTHSTNTRKHSCVRRLHTLVDERNEALYTATPSTSSTPYHSSAWLSPRRRKIVDFPNRDWSYVEYEKSRKKNEYCGGYDYHDDVDSIDTLEADWRRHDRTARARKDRHSRCPVSSLRKEPRYGNHRTRHSMASSSRVSFTLRPQNGESHCEVERQRSSMDGNSFLIDRHKKPGSRRVEITDHCDWNRNSNRFDSYRPPNYKKRTTYHHQPPRNSRRFDIYVDDSTSLSGYLTWRQSCSTSSSCSEEPHGNEMCFAKGMSRFWENPQLLNAKTVPELPAGFLRRNDGVVISVASSSQSRYDKYAEGHRRDEDENSAEAKAQLVVQDLRKMGYRIDDQNGILGSNSDSGIFSEFIGPPNAPLSNGCQGPTCVRASKDDSASIDSKVSLTGHGENVFIAAHSFNSTASLQSSNIRENISRNIAARKQPKIARGQQSPELWKRNESKNGAISGASTVMADGSTITSMPTSVDGQQAEVFFQSDDQSWQDDPVYVRRPQSTRHEDHIPAEIVTNITDRVPMVTSDLSGYHLVGLQPKVERSVVDAFREEIHGYPLNPLNNLCDRLILTCHIAAFPVLKR